MIIVEGSARIPEDAWRCFQRSDIDYLVIDRFVIEKDL